VVIETVSSGISSLPFGSFVVAMVPIHLAIGVVEGVVTATVVTLVATVEPGIVLPTASPQNKRSRRNAVLGIVVAALVIGGLFSWFASGNPDGLEWSVRQVTGSEEIEATAHPLQRAAGWLQGKLSFLPDYGFKTGASGASATTVSGLVGGGVTLGVVFVLALLLRGRSRDGRRSGHRRHSTDALD
jgi:cobalt/nickel transport system permease protein